MPNLKSITEIKTATLAGSSVRTICGKATVKVKKTQSGGKNVKLDFIERQWKPLEDNYFHLLETSSMLHM